MIKSINDKPKARQVEIDLTGPNGNVFVLMGMVPDFCKMLGRHDAEFIKQQMMSSDYEYALKVFDEAFGSFVIMYR